MLVKVTKEQNKGLRWVHKATAKDKGRPQLHGINLNTHAVGTDGFRLHILNANMGENNPDGRGIVEFGKIPASSTVLEGELVEGNYPDYHSILDTSRLEVKAEIVVKAQYLVEALEGMKGKDQNYTGNWARLVIYEGSKPMEIFGYVGGNEAYAMIMPIFIAEGGDPLKWKPRKGE